MRNCIKSNKKVENHCSKSYIKVIPFYAVDGAKEVTVPADLGPDPVYFSYWGFLRCLVAVKQFNGKLTDWKALGVRSLKKNWTLGGRNWTLTML